MKSPSKPPAALAVLVGSAGGSSPKGKKMKKAAEEPDDLELAAEEFLAAVKAGDAAALAEAFEAMSSMCNYSDEEE